MSDWRATTIGELCADGAGFVRTGPFGSQLHRSDYVDDDAGIPVVMPKDMVNGKIDQDSVARISKSTAERLSVHLLEAGDVVLSRRGDVGRSVAIKQADLPALVGTGSMRIHLGPTPAINPVYFQYLMQSRSVVDYLEGQAVGSTMPNLNGGIVTSVPLAVPPRAHQDAAARALGTIDDLIENNRRRIVLLEEMAQAIYREWFVHFRYPGHESAKFVESPFGPIPEGWEAKPLDKIAVLTMGQSPPSESYNDEGDGRPFHQGVKDFGTHFPTHRICCSVLGRMASEGDVLISVRAPVGRLNIAPSELTIGRGLRRPGTNR